MFNIKNHNKLSAFLIFFAGLFIFTIGLSSQEVIGFESRFYLFAQEMWRNGIAWFPTTYNHPYPDYTSASTIFIYFFAKIFGGLNKFTAVLPSAIAAALTLSITYLIACLQHKRMALASVFLLILTFTFFKSARLITLDLYTTCFTAICFYLIYSADILDKPRRIAWVFLFLFISFVFRGPIGIVMPTGVIVSYYALEHKWSKMIGLGVLASLLLLASTVGLLILAKNIGGDHFMQAVLRMQISGRLADHYRPFYFYFTNSFLNYAISYPLAISVLIGVLLHAKRMAQTDLKFVLKLFGWMFIILIGMSFAGDKKTRYILPMSPAIALIAAYLFNQFRIQYFIQLQRIVTWLFLFLPLVLIVAVEAIYFYDAKNALELNIHYWVLIAALFILQIINFVIMYYWFRQQSKLALLALMTLTIAFILTYVMAIEQVILHVERGRYLVQGIEKQRLNMQADLIFYKEEPDSLVIKYLIDMPQPTQPQFIYHAEELTKLNKPAVIVTKEKNFLQLPPAIKQTMRILANDRLGHVRMIIFTNQKEKSHEQSQ